MAVLETGIYGDLYVSYSFTSTGKGQGTLTWNYYTTSSRASSAYSNFSFSFDGSSVTVTPTGYGEYVTFKTENISADGTYSKTYNLETTYTRVSTGRVYTDSQTMTVNEQLVDLTAPTIDSISASISRTGQLSASATFHGPYKCDATMTLTLENATQTATGSSTGSSTGTVSMSADVSTCTTENVTYSGTVSVTCENGQTTTQSFTVTRPSRVYSITAPSVLTLTASDTTKWIGAEAKGLNAGACEITTFTYSSSDTSVATVDSIGNVTRVADGTCSITITSTDAYAQCGSSTVGIQCISTATFPEDFPTSDVDYLPSNLMKDIIDAVLYLSISKSISISGDTTMFNNYATQIKSVYNVLNNTNENVKTLCTGTSTTHSLPSSFPYENTSKQWCTIVNEWIRVINLMHNS